MTFIYKLTKHWRNLDFIDDNQVGGRERIRTSGRLTPTPDFESGAFNHSATLPAVDYQALTLVLKPQT